MNSNDVKDFKYLKNDNDEDTGERSTGERKVTQSGKLPRGADLKSLTRWRDGTKKCKGRVCRGGKLEAQSRRTEA